MGKRGCKPRSHEERYWEKVEKTDGCWLWTAYRNPKGYGEYRATRAKKEYAHRFAWFLTYGEMPADCLMHTCDNPSCVNPDHLREGSRADNNADMDKKGRANRRTEKAAKSRRVLVNIDRVIMLRDRGYSFRKIQEVCGLSTGTVNRILRKKHWQQTSNQ